MDIDTTRQLAILRGTGQLFLHPLPDNAPTDSEGLEGYISENLGINPQSVNWEVITQAVTLAGNTPPLNKYSVLFTDHDQGVSVYEFVEAANPEAAYKAAMVQWLESFEGQDPEQLKPENWPSHTFELVIAGHVPSLHQ